MKFRLILFPVLLLGFVQLTVAQISPVHIKQFIESEELMRSAEISHAKEIREYYSILNYSLSWMGELNEYNKDILIRLLENAHKAGLVREDYQYSFIQKLSAQPSVLKTHYDSLLAEIKLTDAAIHFFNDFMHGNTRPAFSYDGLNYTASCFNIPQLLAECTSRNQLCLLDKWEPKLVEIVLIRKKIEQFEDIIASEFFAEEKIVSTAVTHSNKPLLKKLYYLGITNSPELTEDKEIKESLREAQSQFNLMEDGVLRSRILAELNTPISIRIQQLRLSINYYRWLYCITREQSVIVVNIPAAYMKVYDQTGVKLEMRMVVGKPSTPTPTLTSRISEVILYPYWTVPRSIATKELLPAIKRNPGYIDANSFQIINSNGRVLDPYKIDWTSITASNFPYTIRQSTGCDNALGLIKLDFYNPFSVYLHDTPSKSFFSMKKRYFSHGCMRMEKPMELGHMVLKNNPIAIDTLEEKRCIYNQSPVIVKADEKMPVIVWYNPVGTDSIGRVIFYEDVYKKLKYK